MLDEEILGIVFLSFQVSGLAVLISTIVGVPLGTLLALLNFRGKKVITTLVHTLMGLPPVVVGLVLYLLLSRSGYLGPLGLLYTPIAMIMAQLVLALPIIIGLSHSAITAIPSRLIEHTVSLGASRIQLAAIVIREARIGIVSAVIAAFGGAISEVGAIMIVGGNIRHFTRTLTTAIILYTEMGEFEKAMILGAILLATAFIINLILTHLQTENALGNRNSLVSRLVAK